MARSAGAGLVVPVTTFLAPPLLKSLLARAPESLAPTEHAGIEDLVTAS